jgi:hypothetical protein
VFAVGYPLLHTLFHAVIEERLFFNKYREEEKGKTIKIIWLDSGMLFVYLGLFLIKR